MTRRIRRLHIHRLGCRHQVQQFLHSLLGRANLGSLAIVARSLETILCSVTIFFTWHPSLEMDSIASCGAWIRTSTPNPIRVERYIASPCSHCLADCPKLLEEASRPFSSNLFLFVRGPLSLVGRLGKTRSPTHCPCAPVRPWQLVARDKVDGCRKGLRGPAISPRSVTINQACPTN